MLTQKSLGIVIITASLFIEINEFGIVLYHYSDAESYPDKLFLNCRLGSAWLDSSCVRRRWMHVFFSMKYTRSSRRKTVGQVPRKDVSLFGRTGWAVKHIHYPSGFQLLCPFSYLRIPHLRESSHKTLSKPLLESPL